jgi:putative DNA primase/helicase
VCACLQLATSEPGVPVLPAQLDADPFALNCTNGTLDLRSGQRRLHCRDEHLTQLRGVVWGEGLAEGLCDQDGPTQFPS